MSDEHAPDSSNPSAVVPGDPAQAVNQTEAAVGAAEEQTANPDAVLEEESAEDDLEDDDLEEDDDELEDDDLEEDDDEEDEEEEAKTEGGAAA